MPSAVVGQQGALGMQKTQSKATVESADTSNVPASVQVCNPSSQHDGRLYTSLALGLLTPLAKTDRCMLA